MDEQAFGPSIVRAVRQTYEMPCFNIACSRKTLVQYLTVSKQLLSHTASNTVDPPTTEHANPYVVYFQDALPPKTVSRESVYLLYPLDALVPLQHQPQNLPQHPPHPGPVLLRAGEHHGRARREHHRLPPLLPLRIPPREQRS